MAAFCGLIGFVVIYHYASFERPLLKFAIVIDAGSTQTRSSLFSVMLDESPEFAATNQYSYLTHPFKDQVALESSQNKQQVEVELNKFVQVRQVSSCVNGDPLTSLRSELNARQLVEKCINKFAQHIKKLDFLAENALDGLNNGENDDDGSGDQLDSQEVSDQLALLNHRVNSVTYLHLGATAGMRSLARLNESKAREKMQWIDSALNASSSLIAEGPMVNKGYVGILDGAQEASFAWISVNFIGENLKFVSESPGEIIKVDNGADNDKNNNKSTLGYHIEQEQKLAKIQEPTKETSRPIESIGTLELGGASAQMAYELPTWWPDEQIKNSSLESQQLKLFNRNYHLATRSDLCLGTSQAVLRAYYVILRDYYELPANREPSNSNNLFNQQVEVENPCLQKASRVSLTGAEVAEILRGVCLAPTGNDSLAQQTRDFMSSRVVVRFLGTGNTLKCNSIVDKLLEPQQCKKYFSLCPESKNTQPPPAQMPFVTISGYNKALASLNLKKSNVKSVFSSTETTEPTSDDTTSTNPQQANEMIIKDKLGGYPIDYVEFTDKTRDFCQVDVGEFPIRFPKIKSQFYSITCMQLVYINKLLTDFYNFDPLGNWSQIMFLIFPAKSQQQNQQQQLKASNKLDSIIAKKRDDKKDIGWTLGLLLNATSFQLEDAEANKADIKYHHGASVLFIMRATVFLMFGCLLIASMTIVFGAVLAKWSNGRRSSVYINPPPSYGTSQPGSLTSAKEAPRETIVQFRDSSVG